MQILSYSLMVTGIFVIIAVFKSYKRMCRKIFFEYCFQKKQKYGIVGDIIRETPCIILIWSYI